MPAHSSHPPSLPLLPAQRSDMHPPACHSCLLLSPCCPAGASLAEYDLGPIELGKARRTGTAAAILAEGTEAATQEAAAGAVAENGAAMTAATTTDTAGEADASQAALAAAAAAAPAVPQISRRCKRRRRELLESTA